MKIIEKAIKRTRKHQDQIIMISRGVRIDYPCGENEGECINASIQLADALDDYNSHIHYGQFKGSGHAWTTVHFEDNESFLFIDITVDQFDKNLPSIVYGWSDWDTNYPLFYMPKKSKIITPGDYEYNWG